MSELLSVKTGTEILVQGITGAVVKKGFSPYIGEDGYWYEWDAETKDFVKTDTPAHGIQGEKGDTGEDGENATITIGNVTTGNTPSVINRGTETNAILDFVVPKGEKGDAGADGIDGTDGSAATITIGNVTSGENPAVSNTGTSTNAVFNFTLPRGEKGDKGDPGSNGENAPIPTIEVGSVSGGAIASVTNSGTDLNAVFNFVLPKGDKGDTGDTGATGNDGLDGQNATITIGSVTKGDEAAVTNVGTETDAVLDFVLPKGDKGDTGDDGFSPTINLTQGVGYVEIVATNKIYETSAIIHDGSDASVTTENIVSALGYTPADEEDVEKKMERYILRLTVSSSGNTLKDLDGNTLTFAQVLSEIRDHSKYAVVLYGNSKLRPQYVTDSEMMFIGLDRASQSSKVLRMLFTPTRLTYEAFELAEDSELRAEIERAEEAEGALRESLTEVEGTTSQLSESIVEISEVTVEKVVSKNLFNKNDSYYLPNKILTPTGAESDNANNSTTGYIECDNGDSFVCGFVNDLTATELAMQNVVFLYLYDENKTFLLRSTQFPFVNYVYTVTDARAKYIRFTLSNALVSKDYVMIAKSNSNLPYEPYQEPHYVNLKDADIERLNAKIDSALGKSINMKVIDCWGDSRTEMISPSGTAYADTLQRLLGNKYIVCNLGKSGQTSGQINAKVGGNIIYVSLDGNKIPSTGNVALTGLKTSSGDMRNLFHATGSDAKSVSLECTLNGVRGKLVTTTATLANDYFARITDGEEVKVNPNTPVYIEDVAKSRNHIAILWWGKNDFARAGNYIVSGILENYESAVKYLGHDKFIILGETMSIKDSYKVGGADRLRVDEINATLAERYPNNFIDINAELISRGLQICGITPTADDNEFISYGWIPRSLMVNLTDTSDTGHPNENGRLAIGTIIHDYMVSKGWV